ncbi:hypothetical protein DPM33_17680 [Mesorhizobium hawassense]|uniref:Uncharacterized protein n=1 Tax=Mesorhizobium hawassense TaxID=1209954 RepID=A0A330HL54_9HYPH|nr:hypothetical protein DPM33_17680 [Mesorhizobium hawassense]
MVDQDECDAQRADLHDAFCFSRQVSRRASGLRVCPKRVRSWAGSARSIPAAATQFT